MSWPEAEVAIDATLVGELLHSQFSTLEGRSCVAVGEGFDNSLWRIGEDLVARLPRRAAAVELLENEIRWLPEIAQHSSLRTPLPLMAGSPSDRFPWPWLVATWVDGVPGDELDAAQRARSAVVLASFLRDLHRVAPEDAPRNPFRGVDLAERASSFTTRLHEVVDLVDAPSVTRAFECGLGAATWSEPARWLHGDLHPGNALYLDGALVGVVDFGDLCAGDPACDLAGGLMALPHSALDTFFSTYGLRDDATVARTIGWAALFGVFFLSLGRVTRPSYRPIGELALANAVQMARDL
jgi:aminoglycoside phosphotransferase (APT) family kinase protein